MEYLPYAASVLMVILTVASATRYITTKLDRHELVFTKVMANHELKDVERFAEVHAAIVKESDAIRRETGEVGAAIREKIREIEIWGRDNFARRGEAIITVDQLKRELRG